MTYVNRFLSIVGAVVLFFMMAYTFVDVCGRYFFNAPLPGGLEITELAMALLIFAGIPLVSAANQHIAIDIFDSVWPSWFVPVQRIFIAITCTVISAVLCWQMVIKMLDAIDFNDVTAAQQIPLAPFVGFMVVMLAITTLVYLHKLAQAFLSNNNARNH